MKAWLIARDDRLGNRVRPEFEQSGGSDPFVVYTHVHTDRRGNLRGRTGQTKTRVQIDVWAKDHAVGAAIAQRIKGTGRDPDQSARGLDHHVGEWPDPAAPDEPVIVQFAELVDTHSDDAPPTGGTEEGWYRHSADYEITYEEW